MEAIIYIGPCPFDEPCVPIGSKDFTRLAREECARFKRQILAHYPIPENSSGSLSTKRCGHEFGEYYEVVALFNHDDEQAAEWAYSIEDDVKGVLDKWI